MTKSKRGKPGKPTKPCKVLRRGQFDPEDFVDDDESEAGLEELAGYDPMSEANRTASLRDILFRKGSKRG